MKLEKPDLSGIGNEKLPWYFRNSFIIIGFFAVGPLVLPLIWWHPKKTRTLEVVLTIGILVISWAMFELMMQSLNSLAEYYKLIEELG